MPDWTSPANGIWTDPARWTGGIPNAAGATANFTVPNPGNATVLIGFSQDAAIRVGTLNIVTDSNQAWTFQGDTGVTSANLLFQGVGGGPAFLNADTNNSSRQSKISDFNGLTVTLASDLIVTTADSDTFFEIRAPITGAFDIYKFGSGTLRVSGGNSGMAGDYYLNGGRTELTSANGVGGGSVIKLNNGATLAGVNTFTLAANMETGSGNAAGFIVAKTGTTLTLAGDLLLHSGSSAAITFGSAADAGTILLSGTSSIAGAGGTILDGGTLRFGSAAAAANYFAAMGPSAALQVKTGAILDTGGFAATIDNLDLDEGTLQSTDGPLNLTSDQSIGNVLEGIVVGTGQLDRLVFNVAGNFDLSGLDFNSWTDGTDTITINGDNSSSTFVGSERNETINGGGGADTLQGNGGIDTIRGGTGDDTYFIVDAQSILIENAGEGTDTILVKNGGPAVFNLAANFENLIFQNAAQHTGIGNTAANVLTGGPGIDALQGREGNDTLLGNGGADTLDGGTGADGMTGGTGDDFYFVDNGSDHAFEKAAEGNDRVFATASFALAAGQEIETLSTDNAAGAAAINLTGNEFVNFIMGNAAGNILNGKEGNDTIVGNAGNDLLIGGTGADSMNGGLGNDSFYVDIGGDQAFEKAGEGSDRVFTGVSYTLIAGQEIETLSTDDDAGTGAINLTGNELANTLIGNDGANALDGKGGNDVLTGNGAADTFAFTSALGAGNVDQVGGFVSGTDKIALGHSIFTAIGLGALNPNAFFSGTAAHDADDRIIYNSTTGALSYDADGNGAGAAVQFATLAGHPALLASDFAVI